MNEIAPNGLHHPWQTPPAAGEAIEVAKGILWLRLPLPMVLDHVNVYALDEGDHWTIVDAGIYTRTSVRIWQELLSGPLAGKPVKRIILTHHHPDHVGMVGWLMADQGAELWTTRTAWLTARSLILAVEDRPSPQAVEFWRRSGMAPEILDARMQERPFNFADVAHPLPVGFRRIQQRDVLRAAGRTWDVRIGHGHAPEHLTLWSRDDNLVIAGDQILPSISPNIGVYPTEPEADPLGEWLTSCESFQPFAREDHLLLGGHKLPFTGLPLRLHQLIENHHGALKRLLVHLEEPRTASECFQVLFKRKIDAGTYGLALAEAVAHLNHLRVLGAVERQQDTQGAWRFQVRTRTKGAATN